MEIYKVDSQTYFPTKDSDPDPIEELGPIEEIGTFSSLKAIQDYIKNHKEDIDSHKRYYIYKLVPGDNNQLYLDSLFAHVDLENFKEFIKIKFED